MSSKKPSYFGRTSYLKASNVRRALEKDLNVLLSLVNNQTTQLFGQFDCRKILKTCFAPTCIRNEHDQPVGFLCLDDYPNVPCVPSCEWSSWLSNIYGLDIATPRNTLWIHLIAFDCNYAYDFAQPMFESIFEKYAFVDYIIMVIPPSVSTLDFLDGHGTRIVPPGFYDASKVQTLFLLVRQHFVTKYKIRRAVEEDNDDLVPLIHLYSNRLKETYGEFYIAEIITKHTDSGRQLIVAEYGDAAVSVLFLNESVNDVLLNDEFELVPFNGLRKPHPGDEFQELYSPSSTDGLADETLVEDAFSKLNTKQKTLERPQSYQEDKLEVDNASTGSEYPEDDISLVGISSVHLVIKEPSDYKSVDSTGSKTYSAMILSMNDYEMHLFADRNALSRVEFDDLEYKAIRTISAPNNTKNFPSFFGELNAFTVELAVSQPEHEIESLPLLLEAAFECFPEREYCVLSLPSTCQSFPMLEHFVRVAPRPVSTYPHELYILHRNAIMSDLKVRVAVISDIEEVQELIDNILVTHTFIDTFLSAVCEEDDFSSYVILSEDKIVGVAVVRDETKYDYLTAHYNLTDLVDEEYYKSSSYGLLLHLVLSPIFLRHSRFFLREIIRLSDYPVLTYCVSPSDTVTMTRERPVCCALGSMILIRPRRMPEFTQTNLEDYVPDNAVTQDKDPFALYIITGQYCSLDYHEINTKIVIVGSSDAALAFLDGLINSESQSYRINFSNITVVSPHGLNYQKMENKVRDMLFVSRSSYNYRQMQLISIRTYINVINGVMTKINRKNKLLVVNETSFIAYDLLFLMCGLQFQKPSTGASRDKKTKEFPENVFLINTEMDATHALGQLKQLTECLPSSEYTIIVYGHAMETFCCVAALLEYGVPAPNITFIESYPPQSDQTNHSVEFEDPEIDRAVSASISKEGVIHYTSYYFVEWTLDKETNQITSARFESSHRRLFINCIAMFMYNEKTVSARTFLAISNAGLVFDGALVIDPNCKTNDPFIYAAGTLTKYSRRYYADHLSHKYFNLEEIGLKLGKRIRSKLIPNFDEHTPDEIFTCTKGSMMVPHYKNSLTIFCHLPGNLQYLSVTKPGKQVPTTIATTADDYGHLLVTGDCKAIDKQGYFRLHLNQHGVVETITCLSKFNIDRQNIASLWGKHEQLLNSLKTRFEMVLISDLYDYFKEPWTCAIYHDRFAGFEATIMDLMTMATSVEGFSPLEDLIRMFKLNDWKKLNFDQKEELEEKFSQSPYFTSIQDKLLEFLQQNVMFLPMYARPHNVRRLLMDCDKSPLFKNQ